MMIKGFRKEINNLQHSHQAVSPQTALVLESNEIRTLTEVGFLAAGNGRLDEALDIFNALRLIRPDRAFPLVGLAVAYLNAGQATNAVTLLENVRLPQRSEQAECDTWLGFALQQSGHQHAAHKTLQTVLDSTKGAATNTSDVPSPQTTALAHALLERNAANMARPNTDNLAIATPQSGPGDSK